MDTSEDHRNQSIDESQASELIRNVLCGGGGESTGKSPEDISSVNDLLLSKNISSESPLGSPRISNPAPRFHYYGLAASPSQTQHHDEYIYNEHSQKENFDASGEVRPGPTSSIDPRPISPHASSSKGSIREPTPHGGQPSHAPPRSTGTKPKTAAAHSLQTSKVTTFTYTNPPASQWKMPSRSKPTAEQFSQDSFAGPVSQDPERDFLATTKEFDIPLSELGRNSQGSRTNALSSKPPSSDMFVFSHGYNGGRGAKSSSVYGNVLVEATPSNSDGSQPQPTQQSPEDVQNESADNLYSNPRRRTHNYEVPVKGDNGDEDVQSEVSTEACHSEASSSYERFVAGEPEPVNGSTEVGEDYPPTQPSTQPDGFGVDYDNMVIDAAALVSGTRADWGTGTTDTKHQGTSAATPSAAPRTLADMVDPRKKWRVKNYAGQPAFPEVATSSRKDHQSCEVLPEMLQSAEDIPHRVPPQNPREGARSARNQVQVSGADDTFDIVPDSESPQDHIQSTPLLVSATPQPSKAVAKHLPPSATEWNSREPGRNDDAEDIVPDSVTAPDPEENGAEDGNDDDDDDDVPLAAVASKRTTTKGNRKGKVQKKSSRIPLEMAPILPFAKGKKPVKKATEPAKPANQQVSNERARAESDSNPAVKDPRKKPHLDRSEPTGSSQHGVVPSSVPGEEEKAAEAMKSLEKTGQKAKSKTPAPADRSTFGRKTRSGSITSKTRKKRRLSETATSDDEEEEEEAGLVPKYERQEEEETEPTDENYMDVDEDKPGPSRGRKTGNAKTQSKWTKKGSKPFSRTSTRTSKASTPLERGPKRLRSFASASTSYTIAGNPTRVFALWKQDGHFYPGTVHSLQSKTKYLVKFDDGTEDHVDIQRMRENGLRDGDNVILTHTHEKATVVDDTRIESEGVIGVEFYIGDELERMDVEMTLIRIAARTISSKWADRILAPDAIVPVVKPKILKRTPSPSKVSMLSVMSGKDGLRKGLLKTGIVITLTVNYDNSQGDKETLAGIIKSNGGTVVDDWFSLIHMDGEHSRSNKQWVVHARDVRWIGKPSLQRVFVLADDFSAKPKYLMALALGVPCLSLNWLHDTIKSGEKDWQPYLLPQGTSIALNARVSQFVDLDWCNCAEHLLEIMSKTNKVASRVFDGMSILCLGTAFVPEVKRKKNSPDLDMSKEASTAVPRIILAMGADRVEAAADTQSASERLSAYDYVVSQDPLPDLGTGVRTVNVEWVKDCLVSRKLTKLPGEHDDDLF